MYILPSKSCLKDILELILMSVSVIGMKHHPFFSKSWPIKKLQFNDI